MVLLILGLIIWTAAHLLRSLAPDLRNTLHLKFGDGYKIIVGVVVLVSLVLMIIGYKNINFIALWDPPAWLTIVNNLLMFIALYIYFTTATVPGTAFVFGTLKNPQLIGFKVWAVAHLLVNGDLASLILFGGLLLWAVLQVVASNRTVSLVDRSTAPIKSPWIHVVLVVVVMFLISLIHTWLGKPPFVA